MKTAASLFISALLLAGCANPPPSNPDVVQDGGAAGAQSPGFCEKPPTDMAKMSQWNELCSPTR